MRQLVIALAVVLTGAYAWAQNDFVEGHAQGDGVRLAFRQAGAGPLIVFLHGHPDDWTLYTAQLREFSRDHLVVAPNLRGYPPSEAPSAVEAYTMPHLLNDLHALLEHVGRERCVLVGNDWGGYVAWVFASAYPDRVERLVILNAPHPAIHLRNVRTDPEQNRASQYERDNNAALPPYPVWYNYYRADPIKTPSRPPRRRSRSAYRPWLCGACATPAMLRASSMVSKRMYRTCAWYGSRTPATTPCARIPRW